MSNVIKKDIVEKIFVQGTCERVVCIFLFSKFSIPKTLYLLDGEADNLQRYLKRYNFQKMSLKVF